MHTFKSNLILHIVHLMTIVAWGLAPTLALPGAFGLPGDNHTNTVVIQTVRHVELYRTWETDRYIIEVQ